MSMSRHPYESPFLISLFHWALSRGKQDCPGLTGHWAFPWGGHWRQLAIIGICKAAADDDSQLGVTPRISSLFPHSQSQSSSLLIWSWQWENTSAVATLPRHLAGSSGPRTLALRFYSLTTPYCPQQGLAGWLAGGCWLIIVDQLTRYFVQAPTPSSRYSSCHRYGTCETLAALVSALCRHVCRKCPATVYRIAFARAHTNIELQIPPILPVPHCHTEIEIEMFNF
ncbi:hypothetical protein F4778DRAFT_587333 [Xylariomycetidae sp. FL2044]|nr:hypothetical protein F4778DRAFT_587333 [Xylariomycetidae sp. FL2044]